MTPYSITVLKQVNSASYPSEKIYQTFPGFLVRKHAKGSFGENEIEEVLTEISKHFVFDVDASNFDERLMLFKPAALPLNPADSYWDVRENPLARCVPDSNDPRVSELENRPKIPIIEGFEEVVIAEDKDHAHLLIVPCAFQLLGRELHPSTHRYTLYQMTDTGLRGVSYGEMWYRCGFLLESRHGGEPLTEYRNTCLKCPHFGDCREHLYSVAHGDTSVDSGVKKELKRLERGADYFMPIDILKNAMKGMSSDLLTYVPLSTAVNAGQGSLTAHAVSAGGWPPTLDPKKVQAIQALRVEANNRAAATRKKHYTTCGEAGSDPKPCALRVTEGVKCTRWRDGSCTRRWTYAGIVHAAKKGLEENPIPYGVLDVIQKLKNAPFLYEHATGTYQGVLGAVWNPEDEQLEYAIYRVMATKMRKEVQSADPDVISDWLALHATESVDVYRAFQEALVPEEEDPKHDPVRAAWNQLVKWFLLQLAIHQEGKFLVCASRSQTGELYQHYVEKPATVHLLPIRGGVSPVASRTKRITIDSDQIRRLSNRFSHAEPELWRLLKGGESDWFTHVPT